MLCPSCGHDNIAGVDRCEECLTPLFNRGIPRSDTEGLSRSVMEDDLSQLEQEFLAVPPHTTAIETVNKMKAARLGCALIIEDGKLLGIFTERDVLNKLSGKDAVVATTLVKESRSRVRWTVSSTKFSGFRNGLS